MLDHLVFGLVSCTYNISLTALLNKARVSHADFMCWCKYFTQNSPTGNRTPAYRVTGGDTCHYTIEDFYTKLRSIKCTLFLAMTMATVLVYNLKLYAGVLRHSNES